jgi:hypothetical protein
VRGIGVSMGRFSLVADALSDGTLLSPLPIATSTAYFYYIVALPEWASLPKVVPFCRWLRAEAAATMSAAPPLPSVWQRHSGGLPHVPTDCFVENQGSQTSGRY